jgi:hypothetical protein
LTGEWRRKGALCKSLSGVNGEDSHGQWKNQAAFDQSCFSGKIK